MSGERKKPLTDFGIKVKLELMRRNKTQNWLIDEIKKNDNSLFVDSSVLNKALTGQVTSGRVVEAVKAVLELSED